MRIKERTNKQNTTHTLKRFGNGKIELYPKLHTLRITGGEPLLSKDTWKVMDELIENPNPNLIFCVNTNLMVKT